MNKAPGVVIYRGWVMGSADEMEEGLSGSITWPAFGRTLGCAMSFHTLGLNV